MDEYNAADRRHIKAAQRAARRVEEERRSVINNIMGSSAGRSYIFDRLQQCHIFETTFSDSPGRSAFAEGERNIGLRELADIMRFCPDQYVAMVREASDREQANARSTGSSDDRSERSSSGSERGAGSSGLGSNGASDYDPGDALSDTDSDNPSAA